MNILITGITGCGKSTVAKKLQELGFNSFDIEDIEGLFAMYDKDTKELSQNFSNENLDSIKQNEWICNIEKLKKLIRENSNSEFNFYCGMASNLNDLIPLFDVKLLLVANNQTTLERLRNRKETWEYGHTEEVRQDILSWKSDWEKEILKKGLIKINASESLEKVVKIILETLENISK